MIRFCVARLALLVCGVGSAALLSGCGLSSNSGIRGGPVDTSSTPPQVSISVHPAAASVVAISQRQQFSATVTGDPQNLGVTWSVDGIPGGNASTGMISSSGVYTASATAGTHTVTATSMANALDSTSAIIAVTDLTGITTYHYNLARDGVNSQEYLLTPSNVNVSKFGKLFSCPVDGALYAEPLWVPSLNVQGSVRNVVFAATQHNTLFAFDADANPCQTLWHVNLLDSAHGGTANEEPFCWDSAGGDIHPEIGVTGTPVIDSISRTLYVVTKSQTGVCDAANLTFHQRLHAIDLATGNEKFSAPVNITASTPGLGDGSSGGVVAFDPQTQNQRPGLALVNGVVYIGWASHQELSPFHGWLLAYNAADVQQQLGIFNVTSNGADGGIWMAGGAPAADSSGNLYLATGNGTFDADQTSTPNNDYGDSVIKLAGASLALLDYFTPHLQLSLSQSDLDLGSGGVTLLPDQASGPVTHLLIAGGKDGTLYVLDRDNMGHFSVLGDGQIVQSITSANNGLFASLAFWQNHLYVAGAAENKSDNLKIFDFHPGSGQFATEPSSTSAHSFGFPGATPVVSSAGASNGIVWALDTNCFGTPSPPSCSPTVGPAILFAFDATNVGTELWDSAQAANGRDEAGGAVKFTVPTVANGRVYVGTQTEVDVYGMLP